MSTVVARLRAAIETTPGPQALLRGVALTMADARALDALIESLCPDESACEYCDTRLCPTCKVGEFRGGIDCAYIHCDGCAHRCRTCRDAMADDGGVLPGRWRA